MRIFTVLLFSLFLQTLSAQQLISVEPKGERSILQLDFQFSGYNVDFRTGIKLYAITYLTTGSNGLPDTASGLIVVPDNRHEDKLAIVAYQHGTTNGREFVPSRLSSGSDEAFFYGGMGYVVSAPDYLGLGDSRGFHPYVHAATEASAGLDMLRATHEFLEQETGDAAADYIFVSGYSQGGHGAMALAQLIEEEHSGEFNLTASAPMSGPYDMSGVMFDQIIGDDQYFFSGYIPYALMGYQEVYGNIYNSLSDIFKPQYIPGMQAFYDGEVTTVELTAFLFANLVLEAGASIPKYMFKDSVLQAMIDDEDHPIRVALRDNDTHQWTADAPMRIYYCMADDQVPFRNSVVADSILRAKGAADLQTFDLVSTADHGQCAPPAIKESLAFFDTFFETTSSREVTRSVERLVVSNPVRNTCILSLPEEGNNWQISLFDMSGRLIKSWSGNPITLDVSEIGSGLYILRAKAPGYEGVEKIYIE